MSDMQYRFRNLEQSFRRVLSRSRSFSPQSWVFHLIINPGAGGFTFEGVRRVFGASIPDGVKLLDESSRRAVEQSPLQCDEREVDLRLHLSAYPSHAGLIAVDIVRASVTEPKGNFHLIISIGGDGTHNEILHALYEQTSAQTLGLCRVFRFPLGSGNDASDASDVDQAWNLLIHGGIEQNTPALQLMTARKKRYYAFNIASIGVDAHINKVTNQLKDRLPGDFYKFAADLSVPMYPRLYNISNMRIEGQGPDGRSFHLDFRLGLLAIGVGGRRTYGHGLPILPGDENICAIELKNLFTNIKMKQLLYKAKHGQLPYVHLFTGGELRVKYSGAIPMQLDGEVVKLQAEDFPLDVKLLKSHVPILSGREQSPD